MEGATWKMDSSLDDIIRSAKKPATQRQDQVAARSKALRANKAAKARGMDVDLVKPPVVKPLAAATNASSEKSAASSKNARRAKRKTAKKPAAKNVAAKPAASLKLKPADIKVTVVRNVGNAALKKPLVVGRGSGRGGGSKAARGRGDARGRVGGIVKPVAVVASAASFGSASKTIGKNKKSGARKVVAVVAQQAGAGKKGKKKAKAVGKTLEQRLGR